MRADHESDRGLGGVECDRVAVVVQLGEARCLHAPPRRSAVDAAQEPCGHALGVLGRRLHHEQEGVRLARRDRQRRAVPRALEARRRDRPGAACVVRHVEVALAEPGRAGIRRIGRDRRLADELRVVAVVVVRVGSAQRAGLPCDAAVGRVARRRELLAGPDGRHADQRLAVGQQRRLRDLGLMERVRRERSLEAAPAVLAQPPAGGVLDPDVRGLGRGHADPVDRRGPAEATRSVEPQRPSREPRRPPRSRARGCAIASGHLSSEPAATRRARPPGGQGSAARSRRAGGCSACGCPARAAR